MAMEVWFGVLLGFLVGFQHHKTPRTLASWSRCVRWIFKMGVLDVIFLDGFLVGWNCGRKVYLQDLVYISLDLKYIYMYVDIMLTYLIVNLEVAYCL